MGRRAATIRREESKHPVTATHFTNRRESKKSWARDPHYWWDVSSTIQVYTPPIPRVLKTAIAYIKFIKI